jgi:mono/diheme cytochrome c family protein
MRFICMCAVVAGFAILPAAGADPEGKAVYDKSCKSCHAPDGKGNPAIGKMFKVEMKDLGSKEVQSKSDAELKKDITQGVGKMKAVAGLTDAQASQVVAYLRTLKK